MREEAADKLRGVLDRMGFPSEINATEDEERVLLEIRGEDSGLVIGKHGATLDALQYLVNKMVNRSEDDASANKPVVVDAEGYRERRAEALVELAQRLAEKARKTGKPQAAAPMSPADRRVMHIALANETDVKTQSEGEGNGRHLVVMPMQAGGGRSSAPRGGGESA